MLPPCREKVHPDKGGHKKTFQTLQVAKEAWDTARQGARPAGNPALVEGQLVLASAQSKQYRVQAQRIQKMKDRIRERPPAQKNRRTANGKATRIDSHEGGGRTRYRGTG